MKEDLDLLRQISEGHDAAMEVFFRKYSPVVYRYALKSSGDTALANEVLNDVMLDVWKKPLRFEAKSKLSTWLISITRFKLIDRYRQNKRHFSDELDEKIVDETIQTGDELIEAAQNAKFVKQCMDGLAQVQKEIMHLAFFEELSYPEIAIIVDCPEGTVKSRVYHAKEALKKCLNQFSLTPSGGTYA